MRRHTETKVITTHFVFCEGCNHKYEVGSEDAKPSTIETCPKHGEYCVYCTDDPEKIGFPLQICPNCSITWTQIMERQREKGSIVGPNLQMKKMDLPEPFIVLRNDTSGWWIGSKEESK